MISEKRKLWLEKNKDYYKQYKIKNEEKLDKQNCQYYLKNKEKIKEYHKQYYLKNKEKINEQNKQNNKINRKKINEYHKQYTKKRYKTDKYLRLKLNIRNRINDALKNNSKIKLTEELLGCTIKECKQHLEKQFQPGMTWENHGINGWHIDHIKPCASFDLSKEEEQQKCFHYTNLQPLWAEENLSKSDIYKE